MEAPSIPPTRLYKLSTFHPVPLTEASSTHLQATFDRLSFSTPTSKKPTATSTLAHSVPSLKLPQFCPYSEAAEA